MRPPVRRQKLEAREKDDQPGEFARKAPGDETDACETLPEADENDLDESDLQDADDGRWDVFILDDDDDPLPDYGDFWFPD